MNRKSKQAVIWLRFKFADTATGRMQVQRAADKLFRLACVSERRTYTEEEVVGMIKAALRTVRCRGQLAFTRADLDAAMQDGGRHPSHGKQCRQSAAREDHLAGIDGIPA